MLDVGQLVPEFSLTDQDGNEVTSQSLLGKRSLVVFVPFAFSSVCSGEVCELQSQFNQLQALDANVVVISVDSKFANAAWAEANNLEIPVLADFWPHGEVSKAFGNFNDEHGCAERTTFVLDAQGKVAEVIPAENLGTARDFDTYTKALENC